SRITGTTVPVLGRIPIDVRLREGGDDGRPVTLSHPESAAGAELRSIAGKLGGRARGLAGMSLGITPRNKF
ncbi:MAG: ATP-binding protein involved in chromosome partitioning, partial [Streptomyces sp.]|nr:ATP-binding protein involved in chromosome partitioning [Streptomyces sp.]